MTAGREPEPPVIRSFRPIADARCRALILGSMPGVASLQAGQYYAHPRNAVWPIMMALLQMDPEAGYEERCRGLLRRGIALWDVAAQCRRPGSADAAIRDCLPNDIPGLIKKCPELRHIYFNGRAAQQLFFRFVPTDLLKDAGIGTHLLPSTSPAYPLAFEDKLAAWRTILDGL